MKNKPEKQLKQKLANKTATIGIMGLGYVGLPLAIAFSQAGFKVLGFDTQSKKVNLINKGQSYITDISSKDLAAAVASKRFLATTAQSRLSEPDVICICVPTPLTKAREPDLSYVIRASQTIAEHLRQGQLIILESTTYPGTTRELVLPALEHSGLKTGQDFHLTYSPERVDPGNKKYGIKNTPKVVGGIDAASTELARILYAQVADTVLAVSSAEVAEMTKIFENTFRHVNIALVNEIAQLCEKMGISVWEVIKAASSKPFGFMPFYPGPGVGGHCIPLDPSYLASKAREYDSKNDAARGKGTLDNLGFGIGKESAHILGRLLKPVRGDASLKKRLPYSREPFLSLDLKLNKSAKHIELLEPLDFNHFSALD